MSAKRTFLEEFDAPAFGILPPLPRLHAGEPLPPRTCEPLPPVNRKLLGAERACMAEKMAIIQREVAAFYHVGLDQVMGRARCAVTISWARQVAMVLVCELTAASDSECAKAFRRDRSNVGYSRRAVRDIAGVYPKIAAELDQLRARIEALPEFGGSK